MILPIEDRWGLLGILEQEHGARQALKKLHADGDLTFEATQAPDQGILLDTTAPLYVSQSLKQSKEFFRQAEASSWLVKPLLLYYAMLACAKACFVFAIPDFFKLTAARTHGISTDYAFRDQIEIATEKIIVRSNGVYPPLEELLVRLPDVDGWYRIFFGKGTSEEHWFSITGNVLAQSGGGVRRQEDEAQEKQSAIRCQQSAERRRTPARVPVPHRSRGSNFNINSRFMTCFVIVSLAKIG